MSGDRVQVHPWAGLSYVTDGIAGIGAGLQSGGVPRVKQAPSDFLVEELPLYQPAGDGEHLYLFVQKTGRTTPSCARIIATHFGVDERSIGYAGLKDARAITRQMFSVHLPGRRRESFGVLAHEGIELLWSDWHTNKLRRGHLAANRFSIRIRDVGPADAIVAHRCLRQLERVGVPNYFGPQRFGIGSNNHLVGLALVKQSWTGALQCLLGDDIERATPPRSARLELSIVRALGRGASHQQACKAIRSNERSMFVSALQSAIFNRVLSDRIESGAIAGLADGDRAQREGQHGSFAVDAAMVADPGLVRDMELLEVHPTGPMWGPKMQRASAMTDLCELGALHAYGIDTHELSRLTDLVGDMGAGERRAMRVRATDVDVEGGSDEVGSYVRCAFTLPGGAFATSVLREIIKNDDSLCATTDRRYDEPAAQESEL